MNKTEQPEHPARKSRTGLIADICTPLLLLVLCGAITAVAAIKPYEKLQTYLNIAFMDNFKNSDPQAGLLIKNNQINTEHQGQTYTEGKILVPAFGEQYATLSCDSISLNVPVYWGTTAALLERGACQATSSVVLGNPGNVVIDAHVNTFFAHLDQMSVGDTVVLYTQYGRFTYEVSETVTFQKTDKRYVIPTEDDRLTLYTCINNVFGSSDDRYAVICKLTERAFYQETEGQNP